MDHRPPTIKEIARQLNVSVSTVSRALSDHPRIGLQTRQRVQALARELNYEPNTQAIFFKQKRTYVIGVVLPSIREEFFSQAISGMETAAMAHEYTILFGQSYDDTERERKVVAAMKKQRVDGLLISLAKETRRFEHLQALEASGTPVVYFDRVPPFQQAHKVYCNLYQGTADLVGWLFGRGYKKVALINGPEKMLASRERLNGYIEGVSRKKFKVDMQMVETTDFSRESTYRAMEKLLSLKHPPTAIISFNDYVHMDAVQYAHRQGIAVNKDIVFVSYANLPITNYTAFPPLASIEQYPYGQGERAMELLVQVLNYKPAPGTEPVYHVEELAATLVMH